jgi:hypothetical protein
MAYELYPAVDEEYNFPPEVRAALAASTELRNTVLPLTQTQRNNLTGPDLWDGRLVLNTTTDRLNRYDAGTSTWKQIADSSEVLAVDSDLDVVIAEVAAHESRLDTIEAGFGGHLQARYTTVSAGLQDNGSGRRYYDVGFAFRAMPPVVSFMRNISGTWEVDSKVATGFAPAGIIYVTGGSLSIGESSYITIID